MKINKQIVADKLLAYLRRELSLDALVNWAEEAIMEGDFPEEDAQLLTEILAKIGLADVRAFGLTWEDCSEFMGALGYRLKVETAVAA